MGSRSLAGAEAGFRPLRRVVTRLSQRIYTRNTAVTHGPLAWSRGIGNGTGDYRVDGGPAARRARAGRGGGVRAGRGRAVVRLVPRARDRVRGAWRVRRRRRGARDRVRRRRRGARAA